MVARLRDANLYDTRAAQPSADAVDVGTLYAVTDEAGIIERSDGTDWQGIGGTTFNTAGMSILLATPTVDDYIDVVVPFDCTITGVTLLADQSGSIVVDIWEDSYANFPPIDADSITASAPPPITAATKSVDTTLVGWTTTLTAGTVLRFNVDSVTDITQATLALTLVRT
jgi:hypothetical protein